MNNKIGGFIIGLVLALPLYTLIQLRRAGQKLDSTTELVAYWVMITLGVAMMIASVFS